MKKLLLEASIFILKAPRLCYAVYVSRSKQKQGTFWLGKWHFGFRIPDSSNSQKTLFLKKAYCFLDWHTFAFKGREILKRLNWSWKEKKMNPARLKSRWFLHVELLMNKFHIDKLANCHWLIKQMIKQYTVVSSFDFSNVVSQKGSMS